PDQRLQLFLRNRYGVLDHHPVIATHIGRWLDARASGQDVESANGGLEGAPPAALRIADGENLAADRKAEIGAALDVLSHVGQRAAERQRAPAHGARRAR